MKSCKKHFKAVLLTSANLTSKIVPPFSKSPKVCLLGAPFDDAIVLRMTRILSTFYRRTYHYYSESTLVILEILQR